MANSIWYKNTFFIFLCEIFRGHTDKVFAGLPWLFKSLWAIITQCTFCIVVSVLMVLMMAMVLTMFVVKKLDSDCFDIDGVDGDGKIITECTMHISKC